MNARFLLPLVAASAVPHLLSAQASPPLLRLVRCAPGVNVACLQAQLTLDATSAVLAGQLDSAAEMQRWTGSLGGRPLTGPGVVLSSRIAPPLRLFVLLDRSGSMKESGWPYARTAITSDLLAPLDSGSVRVAISGFDSHGVKAEIDAARFASPAAARGFLSALSPPSNGNTGLYTAIVEASQQLAKALDEASGSQGVLLVVTDGKNEVGPRDDPDLLRDDGIGKAVSAAHSPRQRTWILGVGSSISDSVLRQVAGANFIKAKLDVVDIGKQLAAIVREFRGERELTFGLSGADAVALARAPWRGTAVLRVTDSVTVTQELAWRPPIFALPAYDGVVDPAALPAVLRESIAGAGSGTTVRGLLIGFFVLIGIVFGTLVPRVVWIRTAEADDAQPVMPAAESPKHAPAKASPEPAPAVASGGLRRDVTEVAPRRATDITVEIPRRG